MVGNQRCVGSVHYCIITDSIDIGGLNYTQNRPYFHEVTVVRKIVTQSVCNFHSLPSLRENRDEMIIIAMSNISNQQLKRLAEKKASSPFTISLHVFPRHANMNIIFTKFTIIITKIPKS